MSPQPSRTSVRVLLEGYVVRNGLVVVDASSTVTLVETASIRVIVDTGSYRERQPLIAALRKAAVNPGSVKFIVNTHMHMDHCGCNDVFDQARVVAHSRESPPAGSMRISDRTELAPGLAVVPTPGHSEGSVSVFVDAERKYVICGDAIPTRENYEKHVPPFINVNPKLALRSMDAIIAWADVIVPGHGPQFPVFAKK